jgi:hypothetical protein
MGVNGAVILFQHYFSHAGPLSGNVHLYKFCVKLIQVL